MFNLLELPRVSWKVRLVFAALSILLLGTLMQQWPHRHDDLAIARWIAWSLMVFSACYLPSTLVVVMFGRMPKMYAGGLAGLRRTPSQIYADTLKERQAIRDRSREL